MKAETCNKVWRDSGALKCWFWGAFACLPLVFATPATSAEASIVLRADKGQITAPFSIADGAIIHAKEANLSKGGQAVYQFTAKEPGTYAVIVALKGNSGTNNVLHVGIDKEDLATEKDGKWQFTAKPELQSIPVGCKSSDGDHLTRGRPTLFKLEAGAHKLVVRGSTAGLRIESFTLRRVPEPPGSLKIAVTQ